MKERERAKTGLSGQGFTLTHKQQAFIDAYLSCGFNASEAARRAGYRGKANVTGARLLANVSISAEIKRRVKERAMSADEVLARLAEQARGTIEDFLTAQGHLSLQKARQAGKMHLLKRLRRRRDGWALELYSAQAALIVIGKAHKLFTRWIEITGENGQPIHVADARAALLGRIAGLSKEPVSDPILAGDTAREVRGG